MVETETLAMLVSSTTRKLPRPMASAASSSLPPVSGPPARAVSARPALQGMWTWPKPSQKASAERLVLHGDIGGHRQAHLQRVAGQLAGSSAMRTGRRCTTLIQLPVAFCAGTTAKAEPVPPQSPRHGR
jgi:hypothetical protein